MGTDKNIKLHIVTDIKDLKELSMASHRMNILKLYRTMLREGSKFENYNFRVYTTEKIRKTFHQHKNETDMDKVNSLIRRAEQDLDMIRRQTTIGKLYVDTKVMLDKS